MSVAATHPSVGTEATLILANASDRGGQDSGAVKALLRNVTGSATIFLGGSTVVTASDFPWLAADGPIEIELEPGESLYGIVAAVAQTVHVLKQGR